MTAQSSAHQHPSTPETFVIAKLGDGFRVYSPDQPQQIYLVSGAPESPRCTCPEFQSRAQEPEARCDHIEAVFGQPVATAPVTSRGPTDGRSDTAVAHTRPTGRRFGMAAVLTEAVHDGVLQLDEPHRTLDPTVRTDASLQDHLHRRFAIGAGGAGSLGVGWLPDFSCHKVRASSRARSDGSLTFGIFLGFPLPYLLKQCLEILGREIAL